MTVSAVFPSPHASLISLTYDGTAQSTHVAGNRPRMEDSVLDRVAQGDPCAVRECIDQFGDLIWSIARRLTHTRADAEDAVQEIFTALWRSAGHFDPAHGSERVFVAMVARRRLIDRMRRATCRHRTEFHDIDSIGWGGPADRRGHSVDVCVEVCVEAQAAAWAVMQLRPELRKVLELGLLRGLSHAQIAQVLQMPLSTVKTTMRRGLIQVREFMTAETVRRLLEVDA